MVDQRPKLPCVPWQAQRLGDAAIYNLLIECRQNTHVLGVVAVKEEPQEPHELTLKRPVVLALAVDERVKTPVASLAESQYAGVVTEGLSQRFRTRIDVDGAHEPAVFEEMGEQHQPCEGFALGGRPDADGKLSSCINSVVWWPKRASIKGFNEF